VALNTIKGREKGRKKDKKRIRKAKRWVLIQTILMRKVKWCT
jgi:hypothetical protein